MHLKKKKRKHKHKIDSPSPVFLKCIGKHVCLICPLWFGCFILPFFSGWHLSSSDKVALSFFFRCRRRLDEVKMSERWTGAGGANGEEEGAGRWSLSDVHPALLHDGRHPLLVLPLVLLVELCRLTVGRAVGVRLVQ